MRGHFKKKDYPRAEVAYRAAFAIKPHWQIAINLADCELRNGKPRDAAEHFYFAKTHLPKEESARLAQIEPRAKEAAAKVFTLNLKVNADGATVRLNNKPAGTTPIDAPIFLDPGPHTLELARTGFKTDVRSVTATAGGEQTLSVLLLADSGVGGAGGSGASGQGGEGGAGGGSGAGGAGGSAEPGDDRPIWPAILLGGVGAAGFAAGIGLTVVANQRHGEAEDLAATCEPLAGCAVQGDALLSDANVFLGIGIGGFVLGAAATAGMIGYLAAPSGGAPSRATWLVVPVLSGDVVGAAWVGTF